MGNLFSCLRPEECERREDLTAPIKAPPSDGPIAANAPDSPVKRLIASESLPGVIGTKPSPDAVTKGSGHDDEGVLTAGRPTLRKEDYNPDGELICECPTGAPWDLLEAGVPNPPNNEERWLTNKALGWFTAPECTELKLLVDTLCRVFQAPYSSMALYYNNCCWLAHTCGFDNGMLAWKVAACPWNCLYKQPQTIVCGELQEDARFHHQVWVQNGLRCYCSAPLLASNGHRLGTVCFMDTVPRRVDAGMCRVLNNFGEMAVRALERHLELAERLKSAQQHIPHGLHTLMEAAQTGTALSGSLTMNAKAECEQGLAGAGSRVMPGLEQGLWGDSTHASDLEADVEEDEEDEKVAMLPSDVKEHAGPAAAPGSAPVSGSVKGQGQKRAGSKQEKLKPADALLASMFARRVRNPDVSRDACCLVIDTGMPGWPVMYAEETWKLWSGFSRSEVMGRQLQHMLAPATPGVAPLNWHTLQLEADAGERFIVSGMVAVQHSPMVPATPLHNSSVLHHPSHQRLSTVQDLEMLPKKNSKDAPPEPLQPLMERVSDTRVTVNSDIGVGTAPGAWHEPDTAAAGVFAPLLPCDGSQSTGAPGTWGLQTEDLLQAMAVREAAQASHLPSNNISDESFAGVLHSANAHLFSTSSAVMHANSESNYPDSGVNALSHSNVGVAGATLTMSGRAFDMSFRPMALDVLDGDSPPMGMPSFVPMEACPPMRRLYAVRLHAASAPSMPTQPLAPTFKLNRHAGTVKKVAASLFPGLSVDQVLGKGGYGTAYSGRWHDVDVVVKVQDHDLPDLEALRTAQIEVALGQMLRHPYLVRTVGHGAAEVEDVLSAFNSTKPPTANTSLSPTEKAAGLGVLTPGRMNSRLTPSSAAYNPLSNWPAENDEWQNYGSACWFSDCDFEDMLHRNPLEDDTVQELTGRLPSPFNFINGVCVAPDASQAVLPAVEALASKLLVRLQTMGSSIDETTAVAGAALAQIAKAGALQRAGTGLALTAQLAQRSTAIHNNDDNQDNDADATNLNQKKHDSPSLFEGNISREQDAITGLLGMAGLNADASPVTQFVAAQQARIDRSPTGRVSDEGSNPAIVYMPVEKKNPAAPPMNKPQAAHCTPPPTPLLNSTTGARMGFPIAPHSPSPTSRMSLESSSGMVTSRGSLDVARRQPSVPVTTEMAAMMASAEIHDQRMGTKPLTFPLQLRTFAVLEFCDGGTLQDAIDRGWLRKGSCHQASPPNLVKILTLASHIACAAAYLHERRVVHADLTAANVLLCTARPAVPLDSAVQLQFARSDSKPRAQAGISEVNTAGSGSSDMKGPSAESSREKPTSAVQQNVGITETEHVSGSSNAGSFKDGEDPLYTLPTKRYSLLPPKARLADEMQFIAKVADFGKSCLLGPEGVVKVGGYATITHMAPEVLTDYILSPAADVYAVGVLIWQMYTGSRPWAGLSHRQILATVVSGATELEWPDNITASLSPKELEVGTAISALGRACMARDPAIRPVMELVEAELVHLLQVMQTDETAPEPK